MSDDDRIRNPFTDLEHEGKQLQADEASEEQSERESQVIPSRDSEQSSGGDSQQLRAAHKYSNSSVR